MMVFSGAFALVALACTSSSTEGPPQPDPPPVSLEREPRGAGDPVADADYLWIGLDSAALVSAGSPTSSSPIPVAGLLGGRFDAESVHSHLVTTLYDELVAQSARRGVSEDDLDARPIVFILDDRVPVSTLIDTMYTASRARRSRMALFTGTPAAPRAVAVEAPSACGIGRGATEFEIDLYIHVDGDHAFFEAHAREAGAPPGGGAPEARRVPNRLPVDVDGLEHCSLQWRDQGEAVARLEAEVCSVDKSRPYELHLEVVENGQTTAELLDVIEGLDRRPDACRSPLVLSFDWPREGRKNAPCADATPVHRLTAAFANSRITELPRARPLEDDWQRILSGR